MTEHQFSTLYNVDSPKLIRNPRIIRRIEAGQPQWNKFQVSITNEQTGEDEFYFVKNILSIEEGREQMRKRQILNDRGVAVPEEFYVAMWEDQSLQPAVVSSDLSEDGKYYVVSTNDSNDILSPDLKMTIDNLNPTQLQDLRRQFAFTAAAGAGVDPANHEPNINPDTLIKIRYGRTGLMFRISVDPNTPSDFTVFAADFGTTDIDIVHEDYFDCLYANYDAVAHLYTSLTRTRYTLPEEFDYPPEFKARLNKSFDKILEDFETVSQKLGGGSLTRNRDNN